MSFDKHEDVSKLVEKYRRLYPDAERSLLRKIIRLEYEKAGSRHKQSLMRTQESAFLRRLDRELARVFSSEPPRLEKQARLRGTPEIKTKNLQKHARLLVLDNEAFKNNDLFEGVAEPEIIMEVLLHSESKALELECLKQHLKTGYKEQVWKPFETFRKLMEKHDYPVIPAPRRSTCEGFDPEYLLEFEKLPIEDQTSLKELYVELLEELGKIVVWVRHGNTLPGFCGLCSSRSGKRNA